MSRVGKLPIVVPDTVKVILDGLNITVEGSKGVLSKSFKGEVSISVADKTIQVEPLSGSKSARAMWGTVRMIINWMVIGVTKGFTEEVEVNGVGYRVAIKGNLLNLSLGKSHSTKIEIPSDIKIEVPRQNGLILWCCDKERLGQFIWLLKQQRPVEPYKGKGIRYINEPVQRKEGKKKG